MLYISRCFLIICLFVIKMWLKDSLEEMCNLLELSDTQCTACYIYKCECDGYACKTECC